MEAEMKYPFRRLNLLQALTLALGAIVFMAGRDAWPQSPPATSQPQAVTEAASDKKTINIPAGTTIILRLDSPLNSESARSGSGVYAETVFPVIVDNRIVIPARTFVQGIVQLEKRGGRFDRASALQMQFTNITFSNNYTLQIDGALQSLPGAERMRADGKEIKRTDQLDKALPRVTGGALLGALFGAVHHSGVGTWPGAAIGAGIGLGSVLIMRGDAVHLPEGQKLEIVLNAPVTIDAAQAKEALQKSHAGFAIDSRGREDVQSRNEPVLRRRAPAPVVPAPNPLLPLSLIGLLRR
jgi:hypothetical protein